VAGAVVRDLESGKEHEVRAKVIVNATGVFADRIRRLDEPETRTVMLFDIHTRDWDDQLLKQLDVPRSGIGRRSAIGSVRADVPPPRDGQEYIRNRLFHAGKYGGESSLLEE